MSTQLQAFFSNQARLLADGDIPNFCRVYAAPLPVYLLDTRAWHLLPSRRMIEGVFRAKYRGVTESGVGRLRACVSQEDWQPTGRAEVEVVWFYIDSSSRRMGRTIATYYLSVTSAGPRVDMLEFREIAFPQLHGWFADRAKQLPSGHMPH